MKTFTLVIIAWDIVIKAFKLVMISWGIVIKTFTLVIPVIAREFVIKRSIGYNCMGYCY